MAASRAADDSANRGTALCLPLLKGVPSETRALVYRLCLVWGFIVSSWASLAATTPLLLKDIVGPVDAAWWQGVFTATTAVSGALSCALLGHYSDRIGRLQMLLPWVTAFFLSTVCVVYAEILRSVWLLWAARLPALAVPSTILLAFAADVVQGSAVLEAHGLLGATFGLSLLVGSVVCGVVGRFFSRFVAICSAALLATCAAFVGGTTVAPSVATPVKHESFEDAARLVRRDPLLRLLIVAFALIRVCNVNAYFMFVLFTNYRLGWQTFDAALALGLMGSLGVVWQVFGVKYIVATHDNVTPFLFFSVGCYPVAMIGYGLASTTNAMYAVAIAGSVTGISASILTSKISVLAAEVGVHGMALGVVGSLQNIIETFAAMLFGQLLSWTMAHYGPEDFWVGTPYFVNALCYVGVFVLLLYAHYAHGLCRPQWVGHFDERKCAAA